MGGKRLKFPKRKKFVSKKGDIVLDNTGEQVSDEEHQKRIQKLKEMGLIK